MVMTNARSDMVKSATLKMTHLDSAAAAQQARMAARSSLYARMEPAPSMVTNPQLLAAVDLG
ncbi:hypothetical protein AB3X93_38080, partial [Paraburkholderia sp. BR14262]|uniref:hypothetical protein n=1 Tax=Paraburkholderia sp. BR14262 TaxID=3236999 RepID=UPI0034CD2B5E